jgi:glycosyltransferase involved in cell wall biosynthesis
MNHLVSCIMPTSGRRKYIPAAIECFMAQTHSAKELIVIDDGPDRVSDLIPSGGMVRYYHLQDRRSIGEKRNIAIGLAGGDYIAHWDDDDWSHPARLREQLKALIGAQGAIAGYSSMYFIDEAGEKAWIYKGDPNYALGTSLFYTRAYWKGGRFLDINVEEDNKFIERAQNSRGLVTRDAGDRMVARIHSRNTCDKKYLRQICTPADFAHVKGLLETSCSSLR